MKPNLFLIGAPKSGTTALAKYLSSHEYIQSCKYKEPFYFADEFQSYHKAKNLKQYLKLFNFKSGVSYYLDASTHYLMSKSAIKNIYCYNKHAKYIVMLRNPYDMIISWHYELLYQGLTCYDLADCIINLEKSYNKYQGDKIIYDYLKVACNGIHLKRVLKTVSKENIKFVFFDDLKENTKETYQNVLDFLEIPESKNVKFKKINYKKTHGNKFIKKFIIRISTTLNYLGIKNTGFGKMLLTYNSNKVKNNNNYFYFSKESRDILNHDINIIENITGKNLSNWKKN